MATRPQAVLSHCKGDTSEPVIEYAIGEALRLAAQALEKRAFITGATGDVEHLLARRVASRRFAIALQYAAGAVLGLLLDVAFVLIVLWGTTPSAH